MLKNLSFVSTIVFPDNHRHRQVLNSLLIFMAAAGIWVMMQLFTNPDSRSANSFNYYLMLILFLVAFISWIGVRIANRAIRNAHHKVTNLEVILNNIADGVLMLDQQNNFLSANPALLRMIPEDELREMSPKPFEKILHWKRKVFAVTVAPIPEVGSVVIFRDQTRCYEADRARDAVLATVSHEFFTPLAVVMNYLEMLLMLTKMEKMDRERFNEYLMRALESSRRLQHLVMNILDQAQIQAGVLDLQEQRFNLPGVLEKSSQFLNISLKQKNLSYQLTIDPNVPTEISSDPERLHQVLVILIGNAIKFTNRGGINVKVFMPGEKKLAIEIADTGPGIPEEQLPDIFEVFRRASNYAQRDRQGAGLGLSIAKEIIIRMGGEISVSSILGVGSVFTISLPLDDIPCS